jgi:hypothetical protein
MREELGKSKNQIEGKSSANAIDEDFLYLHL